MKLTKLVAAPESGTEVPTTCVPPLRGGTHRFAAHPRCWVDVGDAREAYRRNGGPPGAAGAVSRVHHRRLQSIQRIRSIVPMPLKYHSAEDILAADRIQYHGESGVVEFVVERPTGNPAADWYLEKLGTGVMLNVPEAFGSVFIPESELADDLDFVSRSDAK
jgi:hypothetical protein